MFTIPTVNCRPTSNSKEMVELETLDEDSAGLNCGTATVRVGATDSAVDKRIPVRLVRTAAPLRQSDAA